MRTIDDDIARTDIAVDKTNFMKPGQGIADLLYPTQQETFEIAFTQIFGVEVQHPCVIAERRTFDPLKQSEGSVAKLPFGGKIQKSAVGKSIVCEPQLSCFR